MDHVDAPIGQHRLEALVRGRQIERGGTFGGPRMAGSNHPANLHAQAAQRLDVHYADEAGPDDGRANVTERPCTHRFFVGFAPLSAGVSEPQAATIFLSSAARAFASAGLAKRMNRALGCEPSRCGNFPGIRAPRLNMMEACFLSVTCTKVAKSPS